MALEPAFTWKGSANDGLAVVLPGIQSYARGQALGIRPVLEANHQYVIGYDYSIGRFKPEQLAQDMFKSIMRWVPWAPNLKVTLVGFSLGAGMAVLLADKLRTQGVRLHVILVDPPFGADTMKAVPTWLAPVAGPFFKLVSWLTPATLSFSKPESPADEQLQLPRESDMKFMFPGKSPRHYRKMAREADVENQVGHWYRTWFAQLAWLVGGATKLPFTALSDVTVDYIAADSPRNTVVDSKLAYLEWWRRVEFRVVCEVDAEHCATLREQPEYARAFRRLFE